MVSVVSLSFSGLRACQRLVSVLFVGASILLTVSWRATACRSLPPVTLLRCFDPCGVPSTCLFWLSTCLRFPLRVFSVVLTLVVSRPHVFVLGCLLVYGFLSVSSSCLLFFSSSVRSNGIRSVSLRYGIRLL